MILADPAVYPHFDLYPAIQERRKVLGEPNPHSQATFIHARPVVGASAGVNETSTTTGYPFFNICGFIAREIMKISLTVVQTLWSTLTLICILPLHSHRRMSARLRRRAVFRHLLWAHSTLRLTSVRYHTMRF